MKPHRDFQRSCSDVEYVMSVYILLAKARFMVNLSTKSVMKVLQAGIHNHLAWRQLEELEAILQSSISSH